MASAFVEAIMAQSLARRDPEVQAAVEYIKADAEQVRDSVKASKAETINVIWVYMQEIPDDAPPAVKIAYEKLLASVNS